MEGANLPGGDAVDDWDEDRGEEGRDVNDEDILAKGPGQQKEESDAETEEDVAADGAPGGDFGGCGIYG